MTRISNLTSLASADGGDTLPILDVSATTTKKITKTAFLSDVVNGTLISNAAITPLKLDLSVANDAARTGLASPFEGLTVYQEDTDATYIYDGSAWRRQAQWEELGRDSGTTLSLTSIPARKYLQVIATVIDTGGSILPGIRFNNDTATNYADNSNYSNAASGATVSQTRIPAGAAPAASANAQYIVIDILNLSTDMKVCNIKVCDIFATDATTSLNYADIHGKWASNTQINRIDFYNASGTGSFAAASEFVVLGKD